MYVCFHINISFAPCTLNVFSCLSVSALYRVVWKYSAESVLSHTMNLPEKKYILSFPQMSEVDDTNGRYNYMSFGTNQDSGNEYTAS